MCPWTLLLRYLIISSTDQGLNNPSSQILDILCALERCSYVKSSLVHQIKSWTIQVVRSLIYYVLLNVVAMLSDHQFNRSIFEQSKRLDRWYTMCSWTLLLGYLIISATDQYLNKPRGQILDILCGRERCFYVKWSLVQQINIWTIEGVKYLIYYVLVNVVSMLSNHSFNR
jgi:hypothetical protein